MKLIIKDYLILKSRMF